MKKKKFIIIGIVIVIGVAAFLINHFHNKQDEGVMLLSGNVEVTEANIGFKVPGG